MNTDEKNDQQKSCLKEVGSLLHQLEKDNLIQSLTEQIEHQQKELVEKNEQINELLRQQNQNQQIISGIQTDLVSTTVWIE